MASPTAPPPSPKANTPRGFNTHVLTDPDLTGLSLDFANAIASEVSNNTIVSPGRHQTEHPAGEPQLRGCSRQRQLLLTRGRPTPRHSSMRNNQRAPQAALVVLLPIPSMNSHHISAPPSCCSNLALVAWMGGFILIREPVRERGATPSVERQSQPDPKPHPVQPAPEFAAPEVRASLPPAAPHASSPTTEPAPEALPLVGAARVAEAARRFPRSSQCLPESRKSRHRGHATREFRISGNSFRSQECVWPLRNLSLVQSRNTAPWPWTSLRLPPPPPFPPRPSEGVAAEDAHPSPANAASRAPASRLSSTENRAASRSAFDPVLSSARSRGATRKAAATRAKRNSSA